MFSALSRPSRRLLRLGHHLDSRIVSSAGSSTRGSTRSIAGASLLAADVRTPGHYPLGKAIVFLSPRSEKRPSFFFPDRAQISLWKKQLATSIVLRSWHDDVGYVHRSGAGAASAPNTCKILRYSDESRRVPRTGISRVCVAQQYQHQLGVLTESTKFFECNANFGLRSASKSVDGVSHRWHVKDLKWMMVT